MNTFSKIILGALVAILVIIGLAVMLARYLNLSGGARTVSDEPTSFTEVDRQEMRTLLQTAADGETPSAPIYIIGEATGEYRLTAAGEEMARLLRSLEDQ